MSKYTLTKEVKEMVKILREHGISMDVGGCGCCGSPWVKFAKDGKVIVDDEGDCNFNTEAEEYND